MPIVEANGNRYEFPQGTTREQIEQALEEIAAQSTMQQPSQPTMQAPDPQNPQLAAPTYQQEYIESVGPFEAMQIGAGSGVARVLNKVKEFGYEALGATEQAFLEKEGFKQDQLMAMDPLREARPYSTGVGEFVGETIALAPIGGPAAWAGRRLFGVGGRVAGRAGAAGSAGAAETAVLAPEDIGTGAGVAVAAEFGLPWIGRAAVAPFRRYFGKNADAILETGEISPEVRTQIIESGEVPEELLVKSIDEMHRDLSLKKDIIEQVGRERAESLGFTLDEAQALRDYDLQDLKQTVLRSIGPEGDVARGLELKQRTDIERGLQERVLDRYGSSMQLDFTNTSDDFTKVQLGHVVKNAVEELKTRDETLVSAAYKAARESSAPDIRIKPDGALGQRISNALVDHMDLFAVDEKDRQQAYKAMAKYGFFGDAVEKQGAYSYVTNPDDPSSLIKIRGDVEPLTIKNAEEFRKRWTALQKTDQTGLGYVVKSELDRTVNDVIDAFPEGSDTIQGFRVAREAFRNLKSTYEAGDIIQDSIAFKNGSNVEKIAPERLLDQFILGSRTSLDNVQRLKHTLLENNPTAQSKQAWTDIQAVTMENILKRSIGKNGLNGETLKRQINKIGDSTLRELYGDKGFTQIKAIVAAVGDATIPLEGTVNYSNTQTKALNFVSRLFNGFTGGGSDLVLGAAKSAESQRELQKGLSVLAIKRFPQHQKSIQMAQGVADWMKTLTAAGIGAQVAEE